LPLPFYLAKLLRSERIDDIEFFHNRISNKRIRTGSSGLCALRCAMHE